jgi:hypothetical protein
LAKNCALYVAKNCAVLLAEKCVLYITTHTPYITLLITSFIIYTNRFLSDIVQAEAANTMIDWNRNGKIDPADVGISIALNADADEIELVNDKMQKNPKGCLASCLTVIAFAVLATMCVWRLTI